MKVLITGGSGYLGQFLITGLQSVHEIVYTYGSRPLQEAGVVGCKVDLATGEGLEQCFSAHGPFHAVVNCAAISQPAVCEQDPAKARAVNVPQHLLDQLVQQKAKTSVEAVLVHLSTDQVYDGSKAHWAEEDACEPVNTYGRSKVEAERLIQATWPRHAILRSSIITGPLPPLAPLPRTLFLHFVDGALAKGETTFFEDEWRCPVHVQDIVLIVRKLLEGPEALSHQQVYNMGGPDRLSRAHMALQVASVRGHDKARVVAVPAASVSRGVASPADISMNSSKLTQQLGMQLTSFEHSVITTFATV